MGKDYNMPDKGSFLAEEEFAPYLRLVSTTNSSFWDDLNMMRKISLNGLRSNFFSSLKQKFRLNNQQFNSLVGITWKTITNHKKDSQILGLHTERALYLAKVWDTGIDYFNDADLFRKWLARNNPFFDEKPLNLLNTMAGCEIVYKKLQQLAYGISA